MCALSGGRTVIADTPVTCSRATQELGVGVRTLGILVGMAHVTTMKLSIETRERLLALGGEDDSLEDVVVAALDVDEAQRFWDDAEAAAAAETSRSACRTQARRGRGRRLDGQPRLTASAL